MHTSGQNNSKIHRIKNVKVLVYYLYMSADIKGDFKVFVSNLLRYSPNLVFCLYNRFCVCGQNLS